MKKEPPKKYPCLDVPISLAGMVVLPGEMYERMFNDAVSLRMWLKDYEQVLFGTKNLIVTTLSSLHPKSPALEAYIDTLNEIEEFPRDAEKFRGLVFIYIATVTQFIIDPSSGFMESETTLEERCDPTRIH